MVNKIHNKGRLCVKMKTMICDDNRSFVTTMEKYLREYAASRNIKIDIDATYSSETLLETDLQDCDVLFLDIDMPGINGLEAAQTLRNKYKDLIIVFVTYWIEYAPYGYQVNAFRYLMKERLLSEFPQCMDEILAKLHESGETFTILTRDRTLEITYKNIVYIEGTQKRSVIIHILNDDSLLECPGKLSDFETKLTQKGFLRLQKSYLVNMEHIIKIRSYFAFLRDGTKLKVSEKHYSEIKRKFVLWRGKII